MIANNKRSVNYNALSVLESDVNSVLMIMNANLTEEGQLNFIQNIPNPVLYKENKEVADADYEQWKNDIINSVE